MALTLSPEILARWKATKAGVSNGVEALKRELLEDGNGQAARPHRPGVATPKPSGSKPCVCPKGARK